MANEKTYQNLNDWYKKQTKEVKYAIDFAIVAAGCMFVGGCDSLVDSGIFGFILGIIAIAVFGLICGFAFLVIYRIAAEFAPQKTEKILDKLAGDNDEDCEGNDLD